MHNATAVTLSNLVEVRATKIQLNRYYFLARLLTLNQQSRKCPCAVCIDNLSVLFCEPAASQ